MKWHFMFRKILAVLLLIVFSQHTTCQISIEGHIVDKQSKQPIAFSTVSVVYRNKGTSADSTGYFLLHNLAPNDSVTFSAIGYSTVTISIDRVKAELPIKLETLNIKLPLISVHARKRIFAKQFNRCSNNYFYGNPLSAIKQIAQLVTLDDIQSYLSKVTICTDKSGAIFRIRFYKSDEKNYPSTEFTPSSIVVTSVRGRTTIEFDSLSVLLPPEKFFIAIEWLDLPQNETFFKYRTSQGKGRELSYNPGLGFRFTKKSDVQPEVAQKIWCLGYDLKWTQLALSHRIDFLIAVEVRQE